MIKVNKFVINGSLCITKIKLVNVLLSFGLKNFNDGLNDVIKGPKKMIKNKLGKKTCEKITKKIFFVDFYPVWKHHMY